MDPSNENKFYDTDIPYIRCEGSNYEIGLKHGAVGKDLIKKNVETYEKLYQETAQITWDEAKERARKYVPFLEKYWPEILAEMRGIAVGAERDMLDIITLNIRSEICLTNYSDGCSSLSQKNVDSGDVYISQNWDWIKELGEGIVILDIKPKYKPRILMMSEAGIVGKIGFNDSGLGLMMNAIKCGVAQIKLPVHLAIRKCLEATSVDECLYDLERFGIASTSNIMLADKSGKYLSVEASPKGLAILEPNKEGLVLHTNHLYAQERFVKDYPAPNSLSRLERLTELSKGTSASFEDIRRRLSDEDNYPYSICRGVIPNATGVEAMITLATLIVNLSEKKGEISFGRPSEGHKRYKLSFN
ncbi:uncharacterized protein PRCAT00005123001 [Priceomyces carsonii]|uniref:uncharacterized protein n=1 Tax=Priceomyces carsonii TaxID=28549 RepID=UPI002ED9573F|nr:unnamed protein product [Priceomyces carsonii]